MWHSRWASPASGIGPDAQPDEGHRRAALRCAAHDLGADLRHRQHVPGHAGGARLGRPARRFPTSPSRGRSARTARPTPSSCATTCRSAAARSSPPTTWSTASSGSRIPRSRRPMPGAPATSRNCARPIPTPSNTSSSEPYSELLLQLTMFTNVIHNKESVEALGKDYGIKGADGTGPWCFDSWQPRTEIVLKRHDAYKWGPSMYKNKGPVKFEKLVIKIVPEDSSRVAAMMAGQFDITHQFPPQFIAQAKAAPMLTVHRGQAQLPAALFRLQDDAADGGRQARARGHEHRHQPRRDRQGHPARQRRSGLHLRRSGGARLRRRRPRASSRRTSSAPRSCSTRPAGSPAPTASARRTASSCSPRSTTRQAGNTPRVAEAIQGYLRKIGVALAASALGLDHRRRQDGRAGLRDLVGDGALPVGRRPHEHLLRFHATSRRPTG